MLVVEVDVIDAEARERRVASLVDVLGIASMRGAVRRAAHVAELGRQHHLVAPSLDRPADQLLVGERPVHVGRVQEGDAQVQGAVDGLGRLGLVAGAVEVVMPMQPSPSSDTSRPASFRVLISTS